MSEFPAAAFWIAVLLLLAGWCSSNWIVSFARVLDLYVVIPVADYWRVPQELARMQTGDFRYLWSQHNEHRILFPDIVFTCDTLFLHGSRILPIVVSVLCYLGSWLLVALAIAREHRLSRPARLLIVLLAGTIIGWKGSALALADPFLLQWTLLAGSVLTSLALLSYLRPDSSPTMLAGAIVAAIVATYSSGNGLLLWPVLLGAGWLLRLSRRQLAWLAASGALTVGLYFVGYRFSHDTDFGRLIEHPLYALQFLGIYFSMPFGGFKSPRFGLYVGLPQLAVTLLLAILAARYRNLRRPFAVLAFGWYLFLLLSALLIVAGRMDPGDNTFTAAKVPRYLVPVLLNWGIFAALLLWSAALRLGSAFAVPLLALILAVLAFVGFRKLGWWFQTGMNDFIESQVAELSIEDGLSEFRLRRFLFPDPGFIAQYLPAMQSAHVSIYHHDPGKWLGQPLTRYAPLLSPAISGNVTRLFPVMSGVEVVGWANDPRLEHVILVNAGGKIIGLGRRPPQGLPSELLTPATPPRLAWVAFVPAKYASGSFSTYILRPDTQKLSALAQVATFPSVSALAKNDVAQPLAGILWQMDAAWTRNGTPAVELYGASPDGAVYASWSGSDARTGSLHARFAAPAQNCVVLPVLHGPVTAGLSVELHDAASGRLLGQVPMQDEDMQWEFWRIPFTPQLQRAEGVRLEVVATDRGSGPGQWLAVASPAACR